MTQDAMPPMGTIRRIGPPRHLRLWLCAVLAGVVLGLIGVPETGLRSVRARLLEHPVRSHVTVVAIDDRTLAAIGQWPFPRSIHARLIDRLFAMGASRIVYNVTFPAPSSAAQDLAFRKALMRHRSSIVLTSNVTEDQAGNLKNSMPIFTFVPVANSNYEIAQNGSVSELPFDFEFRGRKYQSVAGALAGRSASSLSRFPVDSSIMRSSVPFVSMSDVLYGRVDRRLIAGRRLIVGATSAQLQDIALVYPYGRVSSTALFAIGAETLLEGQPRDFGPVPALAISALIGFLSGFVRRRVTRIAFLVVATIAGPALTLCIPSYMTVSLLPGITVCLVLIVLESSFLLRDALRARATTNQVSGLLNLVALRQRALQPDMRLIVARIHNFAEVTAALPPEDEATLIAQIATRLEFGSGGADLHHGDNGVFAWFAPETAAEIGERLDALHALFRSPVTVSGQNVDLVVTFGVDGDGERSVANRLGSALVAATEAATEGVRWREFDTATLADAAWKLSLLSQLDAAIDEGDLWVAYQPKLDLGTRRLIGAEALVRWTHPEKGAISPIEFVAAAEQHNRIEKLTMHVLDRAVLACATINAHGIAFGIAVNLSTRLLEDRAIVDAVAATLATHRLDPGRLTLEITETATLTSVTSLEVLAELRALGVRISIDDYGTGLSTLDYLKKIPASEIKIDRGFVSSMLSGGSDLLMVNSTIQLAHSLGHIVVAEGVESDEVLARLAELQCDVAQGYRIGRPMTFQDLARRLLAERRHAA